MNSPHPEALRLLADHLDGLACEAPHRTACRRAVDGQAPTTERYVDESVDRLCGARVVDPANSCERWPKPKEPCCRPA